MSGYFFCIFLKKALILQKFLLVLVCNVFFIVMRQVIKKNLEVLVEMIDKMRSSNVDPLLKPQDEDTKNE